MLEEHETLLTELNAIYGVPPRYLVSLWGLESNFGDYLGDYEVIRSLATLAYDPRRGKSFRGQLFSALQILDESPFRPQDLEGSWAGAMGQVQFMPSTYLAYAVDHDGDGRKDIWGSVPDALASAANYLDKAGWRQGQAWGRRVRLPEGLELTGRQSDARSLEEWSRRGVLRYDGGELPRAKMRGSIVRPTDESTPAFLVYPNYHAILAWNRSTFFGISVGALADLVSGRSTEQICLR
jgi:membrane-bound lytic murein transglycosylase B